MSFRFVTDRLTQLELDGAGRRIGSLVVAALAMSFGSVCTAQVLLDEHPGAKIGAGLEEHRGKMIPLDLTFRNSHGEKTSLRSFFDGEHPVALILGYYDCPLLCTRVFEGALQSFNDLGFTLGEDFRAVTVSIDPTNTLQQAQAKQSDMLRGYKRAVDDDDKAWSFLLSDKTSVRQLADSVGFEFRYMPESGQYSHVAVLMVLSPDGEISNYLYGVDFPSSQLRLALLDASDGRIGGIFGRVLLFCHVVTADGKYTLAAFRVMQISAGLTVLVLGGGLGGLFLYGSRHRRKAGRSRQDDVVTQSGSMEVESVTLETAKAH